MMAWLVYSVSGVFGLFTLAIILSRTLVFATARKQNRLAAPEIAAQLKEGNVPGAISICENYKKSPIARTVVEGLKIFEEYRQLQPIDVITKRAQDAMNRSIPITISDELRGSLGFLEAIGAVAPIFALWYSKQAATVLGVLITAPAIGYGVLGRNSIAKFELEMKNAASELASFIEVHGPIVLKGASKKTPKKAPR